MRTNPYSQSRRNRAICTAHRDYEDDRMIGSCAVEVDWEQNLRFGVAASCRNPWIAGRALQLVHAIRRGTVVWIIENLVSPLVICWTA